MPYFNYNLSIPANTLEADAVEVEMQVISGILTEVEIEIPSGVMGLAHFKVFHQESQIIPLAPSHWLTGNNDHIKVRPMHSIPRSATVLIAKGYSDDDTYAHTIKFRIEVLSRKQAFPFEYLESLTTVLKEQLENLNSAIERLENTMREFVNLWLQPQQAESPSTEGE